MKRFTETAKWTDPWFRKLSPASKLAWIYLCDNCDSAGVIDLDRDLGNFAIGFEVDWDAFFESAGSRCEVLSNGKILITGFIGFQYGELSEACRPHRPILALVAKHRISQRVLKGYQNITNTPQDKTRTRQEQDKDLEGGVGETIDEPEADPFEDLRDRFTACWNSAPGVRPVLTLSSGRESQLRKRLADLIRVERGDVSWLDALELAVASKFPLKMTRGDPGGWKPDVDWILKPESVPAILEGKYDWTPTNDRRRSDPGPGQRHVEGTSTRAPTFGWTD